MDKDPTIISEATWNCCTCKKGKVYYTFNKDPSGKFWKAMFPQLRGIVNYGI